MADRYDEFLDIFSDVAIKEGYSALDRYRDFRDVFLGSDSGRRVLKQIMTWSHLAAPHAAGTPVDEKKILISEGQRNLALTIMATLLKEPEAKPEKQNVRSSENA